MKTLSVFHKRTVRRSRSSNKSYVQALAVNRMIWYPHSKHQKTQDGMIKPISIAETVILDCQRGRKFLIQSHLEDLPFTFQYLLVQRKKFKH